MSLSGYGFMKNNFKILVVEDDLDFRNFLVDFCDINGYQADVAANGADALKLVMKNGVYDLAIVDFLMPEMHGTNFVEQVRNKGKHFPIIAMSAWGDVEEIFKEAGATVFMKKPFDPCLLEEEIKRIASK
jgi:DNA-binding response OmpR family regulator